MSNEMTDLQYRLDLAKDVYTNLNEALNTRIEESAQQLAKRFQFIRLFRAFNYVWRIAKWECEAEIIFEEISEGTLVVQQLASLNEFNQFLAYHKPWIVEYFRFANVFPQGEDPEEMYNAITFGGEV